MINNEKKIVSKVVFEPQISSFTHQISSFTHWRTTIEPLRHRYQLRIKPSSHASTQDSECNAHIHNSKESNPTSEYLLGFTCIVVGLYVKYTN